jgi:hypothetical protein
MMGRVLRLRFDVPSIALDSWLPGHDDRITVPIKLEDLAGTMSVNLSPESVEKEAESDDQGQLLFWRPIACGQLDVRIEANWGAHWADNKPRFKAAQELTSTYVNRLLSYFAVELGQYWVGSLPMREWGLPYFLETGRARWLDPSGESTVLPEKKGIFALPPFRDFWESSFAVGPGTWRDMSETLQAGYEPNLSRVLMAKAKRYFENAEYRAAVVESVTALETGLAALIRQLCGKKGISHNKLKDVSHHLGVAVYLKVLLPLVVEAKELDNWGLGYRQRLEQSLVPHPWVVGDHQGPAVIRACIDLNGLRNKIVHEGWIPSQEADLNQIKYGIRAAHWLVDFAADAT